MDSAIRWGATQTQPILMIPGPTELPFPVVAAMNQPAAIQYDASFDLAVLEPTVLSLREIFQTGRGEVKVERVVFVTFVIDNLDRHVIRP